MKKNHQMSQIKHSKIEARNAAAIFFMYARQVYISFVFKLNTRSTVTLGTSHVGLVWKGTSYLCET